MPSYRPQIYNPQQGQFQRQPTGSFIETDGIVQPAIAPGAIGGVRRDGVISGTTGEWDAIASTTGGLIPGNYYFLNVSEAGKITSFPPNSGQLVKLGIAKSSTELILDISDPVGL
ncbi:MAG TPA: hypothetical protein DD990_09390 [Cyanobacteria bacterium UBA11368]|nr:hypothetical protein [Cyanobacteria bacterium UBA11368]